MSFALAMLFLTFSRALWHFWMIGVFTSLGGTSNTLGTALVTDLVDRKKLGFGISLFQAIYWVGFVFGFSITGYVIQNFGFRVTFMTAITLPVIGTILLIPIREFRRLKNRIS